ncbi:DUF6571 family protein [Streptomyces decoyicus]|uniref:DUF6571 family protein n=1 Tax=Streptomyces decoyicus TaxID=249567 RepID=UPI0004ABB364|nr:DUF6571 family protein [Streptomyces decoyicus]KOG50580.1 hypothetical protein ADK74_00600 [Streptomyces decoyicus]QZY15170.1 hypothetical protein K7C20_07830 [Streptomyces decoyicus]
MVTFSDLLHADLGKLQAAADEWKLLPKKYQGLQELFEARVTKPLKSDWHGNAADQAQKSLAEIKKQYGAAAEEAQAIATLLLDAHAEFSSAQKKLRRIIDEEASAEKLEVLDGGTVIDADLDNQGLTDAYRDTFLPERKAKIEAMQRRIEKVLRDATAADEAADWALRQDSNGKNSDSFNKNIYTSLDAARGAQKDTAEALRLASKGGENLSNEELDRLGSILAKRKNDMVFAEKFATTMGPKGVLEFWREASGPNSGERGSERNAALKQLQAGLGSTLGIATQSDSAAMDGWKEKMLALGPQTIDPGDSGGPSAKGYQLMSSLMRSGAYDTDFLNDYGRDLVKYEQSRSPATPRELWAPDSTMPRIDYSGDGPGADPMTGYMDALSTNPEAATQFLDPGEPRENGNLKYLVDDREWVKDGFHEKTGQGSLALAIEAGATGHQPGHEDAVREHTASQARIMRDSINMLDGGMENKKLPDGMHRPIANALGDYVADTHHILTSVNDKASGHSAEDSSGVWNDKKTGQLRMAVDRGSLIRVMRGVSEDPAAYHVIQSAETVHVAQQLADIAPSASADEIKGVMSNSAKAMGAIDAVQGDVILDDRDGKLGAHKWAIGKAGYHTTAGIVTKFPVVGDIAVRLTDAGATAWQEHMDSVTKARAAEDIEENVLGEVDKGGQAGVNAMVAKWYETHGRDSDAPDVDFAQNDMQGFYQNGRNNTQVALGRGGENS